jgi:hypothetical protein
VTDPRADLHRVKMRAEADLDAAFRPASVAVRAAVERHAVEMPDGPRITVGAYLAILRDVDAILDGLFGHFAGQDSPVMRIVAGRAQEARFVPVKRAVAQIRAEVGGELLRRMEDGSSNA